MNKITHVLLLSLLLPVITIQAMNNINESLFDAVRRGNTEEIKRLIALGATVDARDGYGRTPLVYATYYYQESACKLLIDAMFQPIQENKAKIVIFLGLKKFYHISYIDPIDKPTIQLIAAVMLAHTTQQQNIALKQIKTQLTDAQDIDYRPFGNGDFECLYDGSDLWMRKYALQRSLIEYANERLETSVKRLKIDTQ